MPPLPENEQQIYADADLGDAELQQWLTSVGDGADINLPGLDIGLPTGVRNIEAGMARVDKTTTDQLPNGEEEDDDEPEDDETPIDPPTPDPTAQTSSTPDFIEVNGQQIPRADIERLYQFDQYLRANPDAAQRVQAAIPAPTATSAGGQPNVPSPPAPANQVAEFEEPTPPDFLDLDDPAQKFQWDSHVATQKALFDRDQRDTRLFAQQAQERQAQTNRQAAVDMTTALDKFKQTHPNLNEDDITKIRKAAGPFVGGMLAQLPPVDALIRSMEVGGMMDDDIRTKLTDPTVRTQSEKTKTRHRKARLGELSGSGRSAPKTDTARPTFTSDKDFINAIAQELSESMQR
jgi:hypothetical protein